MPDVAVLLTCFNRPKLVRDAIASVLEQDCDRAKLIILDDGSNDETRDAIVSSLLASKVPTRAVSFRKCCGGQVLDSNRVTWWQGPQRSMAERKAYIPYSWTINIGLNYLLRDEKYVCYLVDDDMFYPESIRVRAEYLDANPDVHVVYGRSRSVQYGVDGSFNKWADSGLPIPGRYFPRPTGRSELLNNGQSARTYFENGERDLETGLDYVEEAFWYPGPIAYGEQGSTDHNQVMHRRQCLQLCQQWPLRAEHDNAGRAYSEYWGEDLRWGVGDKAFFTLLGEAHDFMGIDVWTCSKRFHSKSWGNPDNEVRE